MSAKVSIRRPDGTTALAPTYFGTSGFGVELPSINQGGIWAIILDPEGTATGSATLTLSEDVTGSIAIGGSATTVAMDRVGQNGGVTFTGSAGQQLGLAVGNVTVGGGATSSLLTEVRKPSGGVFGSGSFGLNSSWGTELDFTLPETGTYTIFLDPQKLNTGAATLTLSEDVAGSVAIGGSATTVAMDRVAENGRVTFTGSAGQQLGLAVGNVTVGGGASSSLLTEVRKPSGGVFGPSSFALTSTWGAELDFTLPETGTYTIFLDPQKLQTGSATLTLSEDVVASITTNAASTTVTTARTGQNVRVGFAGAAGQTLRLGLSGVTISSMACCGAFADVREPDGSSLTAIAFGTNGTENDVAMLPVDGTYTIVIDPQRLVSGSVTLTLKVRGDAPYDGADVSACGTVPVFRAQPVSATTQYQFQVASDAGFGSLVADSGLVPKTNTFTPAAGALASGQAYHWRWKTSTGSWSIGRSFTTGLPKLGARESSATWSLGPLTVNQVNGNLLVGLPGPSYPTATGAIGASLAYNSLDSANRGFGSGWLLDAGAGEAGAPVLLFDHNLFVGAYRLDAVEAIYSDGSSTCFTHVGETNTYIAAPGDGQQLSKNADGSWTLVSGDTIASFSVADGATGIASLTSVESTSASAGNGKLTYSYAVADPTKVVGVTDGAGRSLSFTWASLNPAGCAAAIVCVTGPDGVTWRYVGDAAGGTAGKLLRVNNGTRDLAEVGYDASARVNKLRNANDLDPTAASPGHNSTHAFEITYGASGKVASVSEGPVTGQTPSTSTWSFDYFPGAVTTSATRAAHAGMVLGTARSADGYTTVTPPRQQGQPSPTSTRTYYDNLGHPIEIVDLLGNRVLAHYNARDQLLWTEDEDGNPTDHSWDTHNDMLVSTSAPDPDGPGPLARPVVTNRYDETQIGTGAAAGAALEGLQGAYYANANLAGRPTKRQNDAGVDFDWGSAGPSALGSQTEEFSVRWTGNLSVPSTGSYTFATRADDGTRLTVDRVVAVDNWKNQTVATVSSQPITLGAGLHKLVLEYYDRTGPAEVELRWSCSACAPAIADQVVTSSALQPAWLNQTSTVSPLGRVGFQHFAEPASALPDYTLAKLDDGTNVITSFAYDGYGRITRKVMPKGNAGRTIDSTGALLGSPNLTFATDWAYYGLSETAAPPAACGGGGAVNQGELLESVTPHGIATTTTVYDSAGRPVASTNGKGTTCSAYDAEGRLTSAKAPGDAQATTYTYDPAGQARTVTDASGTVTSEYDEAGRVKRSVDSFGAEATFVYDSEGNLSSRTAATGALSSSTNYTTSYGYDEEGALTSLTDPASRGYGFFYDARGNLRATQYPNGTYLWTDYNAAGWLTGLYNRHGTLTAPLPSSVPSDANPLVDYAYTYELEGRKTEEVRSGGSLATETTGYGYDELGRLKTVALPSGVSRTYAFDLDSNRTQIVENGSTVASYSYDPATTAGVDQLTSVTEGGLTRTFSYNSDGEVSAYGDKSLNWDGWGRHSGGTFAAQSVSYEFDPTGFRRVRTSGNVITRYLHEGLFETDGSGTITLADVDGPAGDLAHYSGPPSTSSSVGFLYYNGHGDLAATADDSGARTGAFTYDSFGAPRQTLPSNATAERWTGRWDKKHDTLSDLIEMGARPYDPWLGRFLAVDPIEGGGLNNYDYSLQDPVNSFDLDGRCSACRERHGRESSGKAGQAFGKRHTARSRAKAGLRNIIDRPQALRSQPLRAVYTLLRRHARAAGWEIAYTRSSGIQFIMPGTRGLTKIRIMAGNPRAPASSHVAGPRLYVHVAGRKRVFVPLRGNPEPNYRP